MASPSRYFLPTEYTCKDPPAVYALLPETTSGNHVVMLKRWYEATLNDLVNSLVKSWSHMKLVGDGEPYRPVTYVVDKGKKLLFVVKSVRTRKTITMTLQDPRPNDDVEDRRVGDAMSRLFSELYVTDGGKRKCTKCGGNTYVYSGRVIEDVNPPSEVTIHLVKSKAQTPNGIVDALKKEWTKIAKEDPSIVWTPNHYLEWNSPLSNSPYDSDTEDEDNGSNGDNEEGGEDDSGSSSDEGGEGLGTDWGECDMPDCNAVGQPGEKCMSSPCNSDSGGVYS